MILYLPIKHGHNDYFKITIKHTLLYVHIIYCNENLYDNKILTLEHLSNFGQYQSFTAHTYRFLFIVYDTQP